MQDLKMASASDSKTPVVDTDYEDYLKRIDARFHDLVYNRKTQLFTTDAGASKNFFFDIYLNTFDDPVDRQYHNCNSCRHFIEQYGTLAVVDESGVTRSAIWSLLDIPGPYTKFVVAIMSAVEKAKITGVFVTDQRYLGDPSMNLGDTWKHFHVRMPETARHDSKLQTPYQAMAEKKEDYKNMEEALCRYPSVVTSRALTLLEADALYRSEKVVAQAKFLDALASLQANIHNPRVRANMLWLAVGAAAPGFCHPRSSMIGTLLDDLADGMDFALVKRRFEAKMNPLLYQRPQAAPTTGNLVVAEKIVEKLGIARSLERRYARVDEMQAIWRPSVLPKVPAPGGVFGHLYKQAAGEPLLMLGTNEHITFARFRDNILPRAERIEVYVSSSRGQNFVGVTTAVHADAPPIHQWDFEEQRNPVCWYVMHGGSLPSVWGLKPETWVDVTAVSFNPSMWGAKPTNHTQGAILSLAGAVSSLKSGNALFPECMKAELREIRSTIEAYSASAVLGGVEEGTANGLMIGEKTNNEIRIRVTSKNVITSYTIDRWN